MKTLVEKKRRIEPEEKKERIMEMPKVKSFQQAIDKLVARHQKRQEELGIKEEVKIE